jgi:predicted AAA+ superfamily ATPase
VSDYLAWFEDAYFFFSVRIFDASLARSHSNPKKAYCVDHAVIPSLASGVLVNAGHLLENLVFAGLRRVFPEIFYFKTKTGKEVDFVVPVRTGTTLLVQSCESLADPQTRKREVSALSEAMGELGCEDGTIVTRGEDERIDTNSGTIKVVPVWKFLLELPEAKE